jgi:lysozyme
MLLVFFTSPQSKSLPAQIIIQTAIPLSCPVSTIQPTPIPLICDKPITYAHHISPDGIEFIKQWETLKQAMYNDAPGPLGRCTIGWGHLISSYPCSSNSWPSYISIAQADIYLRQDIDIAEFALFKMDINLNQWQYDSVIDLLYNLGENNFKSTGLKDLLLSGDYDKFTNAVKLTCGDSNGIVWQGLINRRNAEANLFLTGNYKSLPK